MCAIPPPLRLIIDLSNDCNQVSAPVVCHCKDQSNSQCIGVLGLSGTFSPKKLPLPLGDRHPHVTQCSSCQGHSSSHTASTSVQPFLYGYQMLRCTMHCLWERKPPKLPIPLGISRHPARRGPSHCHRQHAKNI